MAAKTAVKKRPAKRAAKRPARRMKAPPAQATSTEPKSAIAVAQGVRSYLEQCRNGGANGYVTIGALKGFPQTTDDPDVVRQVIAVYEQRAAAEPSILRELRLRQRAHDLRASLATLGGTNGATPQDFFIAHGKRWADAQKFPIGYATFREIGVPAAVLKKAGITA